MEVDKNKLERTLELMKQFQLQPHEEAITLLKDMLAPEPRFYVGQPVLVRDWGHNDWQPFNLEKINEYHEGGFIYKTTRGHSFKQCKLDHDAKSLPYWIEHDGSDGDGEKIEIPDNNVLVVVFSDKKEGVFGSRSSGMQLINEAERYCIIPLPQFID